MSLEPYRLKGDHNPRLFVDIDDTLIFWKRTGDGRLGLYDSWEVNAMVFEAVKRFKEKYPDGTLIFWSTGGANYARNWVTEATPELLYERATFLSKYPALPFDGDTFIDDDPANFPWKKLAIHPRNTDALFR